MLGMLDYYPMSGANNVWTPWIKHTEDHLKGTIKEVALVNYGRKQTVASRKRFVVEARDIQVQFTQITVYIDVKKYNSRASKYRPIIHQSRPIIHSF